MMDADHYRAAPSLSIGNSLSVPASPKKPSSGVMAERLDGGCLLYRLPATRRRDPNPADGESLAQQ